MGGGGGSMKAESAISKLSVSTLSGGHYTNQGCVYCSVVTVPITHSLYTAAGNTYVRYRRFQLIVDRTTYVQK